MKPHDTERLHFRPMTDDDLDNMAALLGDPAVMTYYPAPKTREQAQAWIDWNRRNYAGHGHGLWIVETLDGEFVGDCGLTWQEVDGRRELEVGYHVRVAAQGHGYATEAVTACRDFARDVIGATKLVAITHPENVASQRVAEKIGMRLMEEDYGSAIAVRMVLGMDLAVTQQTIGLRDGGVPHPRRRAVTEAMGFFARLAGEVPAQDAWKLGWRT